MLINNAKLSEAVSLQCTSLEKTVTNIFKLHNRPLCFQCLWPKALPLLLKKLQFLASSQTWLKKICANRHWYFDNKLAYSTLKLGSPQTASRQLLGWIPATWSALESPSRLLLGRSKPTRSMSVFHCCLKCIKTQGATSSTWESISSWCECPDSYKTLEWWSTYNLGWYRLHLSLCDKQHLSVCFT